MVALPVINGVHRVALSWRAGTGGPTAVNVMHFYSVTLDPIGLRNALNANVTTSMWCGVVNTASVYQMAITPLDGSSATQISATTGPNWTGSGGTGDYTPALAGIVSLRTALRGRQNRGRLFLPFIAEGVSGNGVYSASTSASQLAWDTFRGAMKTANFPIHVASYGHSLHRTKSPGGGYVLTPVTWTPHSNEVIATTLEATLGTMRPRQSRLR